MSIKTSFTIILIAALIIWSFIYTGFSIGDLMIGIPQIGAFFGQMVPPDWSYLDQITKPMLDTIRMAIVGTFLGSIVSIPVALLCASNIVQTKWIAIPARFILNIVRTIPDLLFSSSVCCGIWYWSNSWCFSIIHINYLYHRKVTMNH